MTSKSESSRIVYKDDPVIGVKDVSLGDMPEWNLSDLYDGPECAALSQDFGDLEIRITAFESYRGKVKDLMGAEFESAIACYEAIDELLEKVASFVQLYHSVDIADPARGRFYQNTIEHLSNLSGRLLFFTLEINRLDSNALKEKMCHEGVSKYAPWLRDLRVLREHEMSDDLERLFLDKSTSGRIAWTRLFDETLAQIQCQVGEERLTLTEAFNRLSEPKEARRKIAAKAIGTSLSEKSSLFTLITNVLAKDKAVEDQWRNFPRPISSRNLSNLVEDDVVEALVSAVKESYSSTSHRYYALKAKWLGKKKLDYWDRNAPLPNSDCRDIPWADACKTVRDAYAEFSTEIAEITDSFFNKNWIDAPARPGKASGAFSHPVVPSAHPYILLNYMGTPNDVMTLAHELGHGVHQVLAGRQGHLICGTPLTLAETASVFGEMLTFKAMLKKEEQPAARRALLASKVEDMLNTSVRQISLHEFERLVHHERGNGELSKERLCEIWLQVTHEALGPAFRYDEEYQFYWTYISHFVQVPFYVYAYAFGDCLVNSLYDVYESGSVTNFQSKYLKMLSAGGSLRHKELLAPFGLDASNPEFWGLGMKTLEGFITELENIAI
ncbi:MAG: oligoendopeptidase F [Candidatus Marinimicrobia bacterium]|nr:oligoendopeptidase F [Candidatus Neomarinimicrobiota bacterium]